MDLLQAIFVLFAFCLLSITQALPLQKGFEGISLRRERRALRPFPVCNQNAIPSGHTSVADVSFWYKNGWFLAVYKDGNINGTSDARSRDIELQLQSVGSSLVRIFSKQTCLYVAMQSSGKVYTTKEPTRETVFQQTHEANGFQTFASEHHSHVNDKTRKYLFLSMRKNGHMKNGKKTTRHNKTTLISVIESREIS
ncbi:hypothetical protein pdam_00016805 [Pocillopora damicornis]|uniref:Fibroblast growth factor n=1 Tax=Pocillopora damicornis TaxID=46731 RepID=A0A3M6TEL3_POCDA|nr:fibroblast growth factor 1-like [Pocillopora damicornis]RMX39820.1 hypothetical protein pdam_00016805 [Pocillopora damicornis]